MDVHHLVTMANQIGAFFETSADSDEAARGIAQHLKNFWDPRMRRQIVAYARRSKGRELTEAVRKAVLMLAAEGRPVSSA